MLFATRSSYVCAIIDDNAESRQGSFIYSLANKNEEAKRIERISERRSKADDEETYLELIETAEDTRITHHISLRLLLVPCRWATVMSEPILRSSFLFDGQIGAHNFLIPAISSTDMVEFCMRDAA